MAKNSMLYNTKQLYCTHTHIIYCSAAFLRFKQSQKQNDLITLTPSRMTNGPFTPDTVLYAAMQ